MVRAQPVSWKVCSTPGCAELVDRTHPCKVHGRPLNARWSKDRDGAEHNRWARAAKKAQPWCSVCGSTKKLDVHHGPNGEPVVLCPEHHAQIDPHARRR
jgi:hypothetical protein